MATAAGKSFRKGLTIVDLMEMFPTDDAAREWFESIVWKNGRTCPHCGSKHTIENTSASENRPYRCQSCGQHFSVKKGTVMEGSPLPYRKWALAIYLHMTSLKGVSSMKLHRDIGVTQKTAWFMLQRIREAFKHDDDESPMSSPTEGDETYMGERERNKHDNQKFKAGRGTIGKTEIVGAKDRTENEVRAQVVQSTDGTTLRRFATNHAQPGSVVYTDDARSYTGLANAFSHKSVCHLATEYVRDMAYITGLKVSEQF